MTEGAWCERLVVGAICFNEVIAEMSFRRADHLLPRSGSVVSRLEVVFERRRAPSRGGLHDC